MLPECPWCKATYKSIDSLSKATSLNKTDLAFPVSQQLPMAPQLEVRLCELFLCLPWNSGCLDLVRVLCVESQLLWVHMYPEYVSSYVPCHVQKTLSCCSYSRILALTIFCPFFQGHWALEEKECARTVPCLAKFTTVSYSLSIDQL